jgi:hypothetical protein
MQFPGYQNRAIAFPGYGNEPTQGYRNDWTPGYQISPVSKNQSTELTGPQTSLVPQHRNARMLEFHCAPMICPTCRNMKPQNAPSGCHQGQFFGQNEVYLAHFLATSKLGCPFCRILLLIFQRFVPTAEKYISRASRDPCNVQAKPTDMSMRLVIEPNQPIGIIIRDGIYLKECIHAHLLCYSPSGNLRAHPFGV